MLCSFISRSKVNSRESGGVCAWSATSVETTVCTARPYPGTVPTTWPSSTATPERSRSCRPRPPWCETFQELQTDAPSASRCVHESCSYFAPPRLTVYFCHWTVRLTHAVHMIKGVVDTKFGYRLPKYIWATQVKPNLGEWYSVGIENYDSLVVMQNLCSWHFCGHLYSIRLLLCNGVM